jgi:hypothetical protein
MRNDEVAGLGRAVVLIGERTGGGNHFGRGELLGDGFAVSIRIGRTHEPITGAAGKGVGVELDVTVATTQALDEAVLLSRLRSEAAPSRCTGRDT